MKIIDLLNKKANGEKLPKIIIIDGERYYLQNIDDLEDLYINAGNNSWTRVESIILNDEIEIIEEKKEENKITPESIKALGMAFGNMKKLFEEGYEKGLKEPKKIENISDEELEQCDGDYDRICLILDRLDEIIDYINNGDTNE